MHLDLVEILTLVLIGFAAGGLGGLLGIGGSIIMIPALVVIFHGQDWGDQHLYQAAAMVVNIAVALPAAMRHRRAGAVRIDLFRLVFPAALAMIIVGVLVSNRLDAVTLERLFALFLAYVVLDSAAKLFTKEKETDGKEARVTKPRGLFVGGVMGFVAGLLGIGGGGIMVPLANIICRVSLRQAIAVSASVMCLTAGVGAALKIVTLEQHGRIWWEALSLAFVLAPSAVLGGYLGAGMTHRLPVRLIRAILTVVLAAAAIRMAF